MSLSDYLPEDAFLVALRNSYDAVRPGNVDGLVDEVQRNLTGAGYTARGTVRQFLLHQLNQSTDIRILSDKVRTYAQALKVVIDHPRVPQDVKDQVAEQVVNDFISSLPGGAEALDRVLGALSGEPEPAAVQDPSPEEVEAFENEIEALLRGLGEGNQDVA